MNPNLPRSRMRQFAPLTLVLSSAVVAAGGYLQALDYPFIFDDLGYITQNQKLAGLHFAELWRIFTEPYNAYSEYFPLRDLSFWLDLTLFGLSPAAFRLHNILLYLLCLPLVYATTLELWRYFRPTDAAGAPWAAAAVTALFALHPTHVEAVVWITGRKEVLSCMFSLLALWLAVKARREYGLSALHAAATLIAFMAVMFSKTPYMTVAPVIAILWLIFRRDISVQNRRYFLLLWPFAILLLAALLLLFIINMGATTTSPIYFGVETAIRALAILGWLARLAASPESRHSFYPLFEDPYFPVMAALGAVVLISALGGGVMLLRKRSLEGFALVAFFLLCMPYLQLFPYSPPSLVSDRFLTLAVWPVILLMVALCWRLKPMSRAALLLIIALPWCFQTIERPREWRGLEALIDANLRAYPGYYMPAVHKIFQFQLRQGLTREAMDTASGITTTEIRDVMTGLVEANHAVADAVATGKPQKAMDMLWKSWLEHKQLPAQAKWNTPINLFWRMKQNMFAFDWRYLAEKLPYDVSVRYNIGLWMVDALKYTDAAAHLRNATESQRLPESVRGTAFYNLGLALMKSGLVAEAETALRAALEQAPPDMRAHCLLSGVYKQTGRTGEAARADAKCPARAPGEETAQGNK